LLPQVNAVQQLTGASNPEGNAFNCTETDLTHVHAAQRNAAHDVNRVWRIKNPAKLHPHRLVECMLAPVARLQAFLLQRYVFTVVISVVITPAHRRPLPCLLCACDQPYSIIYLQSVSMHVTFSVFPAALLAQPYCM
jgi:hypothetical protein